MPHVNLLFVDMTVTCRLLIRPLHYHVYIPHSLIPRPGLCQMPRVTLGTYHVSLPESSIYSTSNISLLSISVALSKFFLLIDSDGSTPNTNQLSSPVLLNRKFVRILDRSTPLISTPRQSILYPCFLDGQVDFNHGMLFSKLILEWSSETWL
jgi:hypothetical protein